MTQAKSCQYLTSVSLTCYQVLHSIFLEDLRDLWGLRAAGNHQPMDVAQGDVVLVTLSHHVDDCLLILVIDH